MDILISRDGELCQHCGATNDLTIDHVDSDFENHELTNLQILCRRCNTSKNNRLRAGRNLKIKRNPGDPGKKRKRKTPLEVVDLNNATAETQLRSHYWPAYQRWIVDVINKRGSILPSEAQYEGAMAVGCSPTTAYSYFRAITSVGGALADETGTKVAVLSPNPPMRSGLGVGTRGEGRGTRRSALDSDKWGRWRPLVGVGGADGGPGQRRWGGVGGTACKGRQSRTGPVRLCGVVE